MRRRCRVTPGGGNPRESATENRPPCIRRVRVKRWGKSPPGGWQQTPHGKPHREQCRIGIARGETRRAALPQQIRVGSLIRPVTAGPEEWSSIRGRLRGTESGLQALRADSRHDSRQIGSYSRRLFPLTPENRAARRGTGREIPAPLSFRSGSALVCAANPVPGFP